MKLLDRYNRVSLLSTICVIIVAGIVYYFTISYILTRQIDKDLLVEETEIFDHVKYEHRLPQIFRSDHLKIRFDVAGADTVQRRFLNTQTFNASEREYEPGRALISSVQLNGKMYRITITESTMETDYLIRFIFMINLGIVFVLLIILMVINRVLMRKLWQPFYQTLSGIKLFNLVGRNSIQEFETQIDEFKELNGEVMAMSLRVLKDYRSLKTFVENASHELMTPLAVINSKLDTLMQIEDLTDKQGALISEVYDTVGRLKKLNRSMLLLSRIENKLLPDQEQVDLRSAVNDKISEFQEMLDDRELSLISSLGPCTIDMSPDLLNVLLNNLMGNAIRHNIPGGKISVILSDHQLSVGNTGTAGPLDPEKIFQRFYKSAESEGTGLGSTLIKEICDSYGHQVSYVYQHDMHYFNIKFIG